MISMERFGGKVALVTGGGGDVAHATCKRLLEEGANIVLTSYSQDNLETNVQRLAEEGFSKDRMRWITGNVCSLEDCEKVANFAVKEFGRIDILVAAAGIIRHNPIDEMSEMDWQDVIDINLTGVFHSVKSVVGVMKEQKYGRIVLISSIGGRTGRPGVGVNYAAAKAGLVGMTQSLGYELGPWNITVNSVAPGPLKGKMFASMKPDSIEKLQAGVRIPRLGEPSDISAAIAYLASDDASWTTGEILDVNGGLQY